MKKLKLKITICWKILTGRFKHFTLISLDEENFTKFVNEYPFELHTIHYSMQPYNSMVLIKKIADSKSDADMILDRARFLHEADEYAKNKK
jgi:hypothetical protein